MTPETTSSGCTVTAPHASLVVAARELSVTYHIVTPRPDKARAPSVIATSFYLPPPTEKVWRAAQFQTLALHRPQRFEQSLVRTIRSHVSAHAQIRHVGAATVGLGFDVMQVFPPYATDFVLCYPMTPSDAYDISYEGQFCSVCEAAWHHHVDTVCPGFLGEVFSSQSRRYEELYSICKFAVTLQSWVDTQADTIFKIALEQLNGEQKTSPYTGDHTRGIFASYVDSSQGLSASTISVGLGDAVPGEPGDHGDR